MASLTNLVAGVFLDTINMEELRNDSEYSIFKTQLLLNILKNVTNYPSNSITYIVISGGNSLSYQNYVKVIHELTKNSITSKSLDIYFYCYINSEYFPTSSYEILYVCVGPRIL